MCLNSGEGPRGLVTVNKVEMKQKRKLRFGREIQYNNHVLGCGEVEEVCILCESLSGKWGVSVCLLALV